MDFVNQAIAQVSDLFRSMTPGARITAGLLLAVVVISFGYLFQNRSAGPDEFLFGGTFLPDGQLNQVEAAIAQAGLSGHRREGNRILVPMGQKAAYLAAVADAGALPPNFHTYLESALDKAGPWESSQATRERLKIAKQQMLGEIIRAMEWVEDAIVLYDEQQQRGITRTREATASVNVKPMVGEALDPRRETALKKLVAHSVVGMRPDDVVVTSLGDTVGLGGDGNVYPDAFKSEYHQTRVAYEQYKKQQILNALSSIPGVRVEVNAELDDTIQETTQNRKPDEKGTALRTVETSETAKQDTTDGGGEPGVTAQGPARQGPSQQLARKNTSDVSKTSEESDFRVGEEQRLVQRTGFTPKEDWATVTIPRSYVENVWKQRNPDSTTPPKDEDLRTIQETLVTKVENIVVPLLTRPNKGEDQYKHVRVEIVDTIPLPDIEPPSMTSAALAWTGRYWTTLAMLGVAVFSLLVLRSVVSAAPAGAATPTVTVTPGMAASPAAERSGAAPADLDELEPARTRLRIKKGASLKDDLVEMVREDPDSAASILRSWIGKAG